MMVHILIRANAPILNDKPRITLTIAYLYPNGTLKNYYDSKEPSTF